MSLTGCADQYKMNKSIDFKSRRFLPYCMPHYVAGGLMGEMWAGCSSRQQFLDKGNKKSFKGMARLLNGGVKLLM